MFAPASYNPTPVPAAADDDAASAPPYALISLPFHLSPIPRAASPTLPRLLPPCAELLRSSENAPPRPCPADMPPAKRRKSAAAAPHKAPRRAYAQDLPPPPLQLVLPYQDPINEPGGF
ncbi:hypothetical protein CSUB01_04612 [Colletotrichum sublineola]|uniref:Uncharacterized protein n=1 Tax=Colletotrichum sublineola TaxID=1173701 RepID=A0A066X0B6_COLSU|nr:hypothetical protein CSUB01_04612 [Colletotrichum sublineola]